MIWMMVREWQSWWISVLHVIWEHFKLIFYISMFCPIWGVTHTHTQTHTYMEFLVSCIKWADTNARRWYALISVQDILILYKYSQTSAFKNLMELAKNIKFYRMTIATHTSVCFSSVSMFCVTNISLLRLRGSIKIKLLRGFSLAE